MKERCLAVLKNDTIGAAKQTLLYGIILWTIAVTIDLGIEIYNWFKNNK